MAVQLALRLARGVSRGSGHGHGGAGIGTGSRQGGGRAATAQLSTRWSIQL